MKLYKTHHGPRGLTLHVCMVAAMSELHFLFEVLLAISFINFSFSDTNHFSSCSGDSSLIFYPFLFFISFYVHILFLLGGYYSFLLYRVTL